MPQRGFQCFFFVVCNVLISGEIGAQPKAAPGRDFTLVSCIWRDARLLKRDALMPESLQDFRDGFGALAISAQADFYPSAHRVGLVIVAGEEVSHLGP